MCNSERESRALSILGCAFRLGFSTRQKVPKIGCHKSISWPPIVFTIIMKKKEVLERADMSAEKGRALDAVFATWIVGKKAKRLGSKGYPCNSSWYECREHSRLLAVLQTEAL